jgi:hypothetical protein
MKSSKTASAEILSRLRERAELPSEVILSIVDDKGGILTVSAPLLGGPFQGDFETVRMKLATGLTRWRARNQTPDKSAG